MVKRLAVATSCLYLTGCAYLAAPPAVPDDVRVKHPTHLPNPVVTNFSEALACMDDLMVIHQVVPIYVASPQITNFTSDRSISSGGTEMLITALSKMAIRSGGVRYVSFSPDVQNVLTLQGAHPNNKTFRAPDFFIRGGLTEFNKTLWNAQNGAGASFEIDGGQIQATGLTAIVRGKKDLTKSISRDASMGTLTMDLNAGFISNLQIIPGASSSNTLALENRAGKSITGDISLAALGLSYSLSENVSEDFNQVLRSLIQVGVIEIVGKLQGVPYWRCLANAGMVEEKDRELRARFIELSARDEADLVRAAQTVLRDLKYYNGPISGKLDPTTQEALQVYQQQMGLMSTGLLGYETFRMMNVYTPARTSPYVPWWQNYNLVERAVATQRVVPPAAETPAPAAQAAPPPKAATKAMPKPNSEPAGKKPEAKPATEKSVANVVSGTTPEAWKKMGPLTQQRLAASQAWLAQAPADRWFVQLLGSDGSQADRIEAFLQKTEQLLGTEQLHVYFVMLRGSERVGVIYGDYASEPEAEAAARKLPKELQEYRPYARQVSKLR